MTQPGSIPSPAEGQIPQTCSHHWVIESAAGPVSPGVCQTCGEVREFENYVAGRPWDDFNLSSRNGEGSAEQLGGLGDHYQEDDDGEE
jgi:hypothetical protein